MKSYVCFNSKAWSEYVEWQHQDKKMLKRINQMIENIRRTPFEGLGKPEPLKEDFGGFWSRRIDRGNRLIYEVTDNHLKIVSCRYHYD